MQTARDTICTSIKRQDTKSSSSVAGSDYLAIDSWATESFTARMMSLSMRAFWIHALVALSCACAFAPAVLASTRYTVNAGSFATIRSGPASYTIGNGAHGWTFDVVDTAHNPW
jgi:hypothetical protein